MDMLQEILYKFRANYSSILSSAILVGSAVYLDKLRSGGDIDLVIVMDSIDEWKDACRSFCSDISEDVITHSINLFNRDKTQYFCLKFNFDEVEFSIDFILKDTLKKFFQDFELYRSKKIYKVSPTKQNAHFVFGRGKRTVTISKENIFDKGLYLIHSPYGVMHENYFYSGILLSKFINGYSILWDNTDAESLVKEFCIKGIKKIIDINGETTMDGVLKAISKYDLMPPEHVKKQIEKYSEVFNKMETEKEVHAVTEKLGLSKKVAEIYQEIYDLFPPDTGRPELRYVRRTWIFPQHLNIMIKMASKMCEKYGGDLDVCNLAIILHDVGLVYGRTSASPEGHEDRGIEYAKEILAKHGYDEEMILKVIGCINVTNAEVEPATVNEKIVRTADALSKFDSCHFIAKAAYSKDIDEYMAWMHKKLKKSYYKICFDEELKYSENAYKYLMQAVESYRKQKEEFS